MKKEETKKKDAIVAQPEPEKAKVVKIEAEFGEVYFKVTKGGDIMRPVKSRMKLYQELDHIYPVGYGEKKRFGITYTGYKHLNKGASISILTPTIVSHDGQEVANPRVERADNTKAVEAVAIRKIGIGFDPLGNVVAVDKSLYYNIYTYFIQSLQAKMSAKKWDESNNRPGKEPLYPNCAIIGTIDEKPEKGKWVFYETASPLGIWADYEHPAILECLTEHTQRQRFGDRIADTIVCRNILKDHPAIGISHAPPQANLGKKKTHVSFVWVYGWRHDLAPPDLKALLKTAERGGDEIEVKAEVIKDVEPEVEKEAIQEQKNGEKTPAEADVPPDDFFLEQEEGQSREPGED